ncbi:porin family protein [Rhodopseudomonas boonkerdii]|uniref:outer membrane protein n=1 Tax=Rhodopseudomonas boonkerdii TaxID=475937 RepID=UPI001E53BE09|nr:outer membrane beta-barrel protein [Rhodopseudomonas boonkerdii]UGV24834.1 porin family protein [Rhodopseudomonas boonkerdii]
MKKFLLGTAALLAMGASASAADLAARPYTKAPAYVAAPIYNWTGFYIGGHVGGAFNGNSGFGGTSDNSDGRFLGGVQAGADYQFAPNWVIGIEGQYSWVGNNNTNIVFGGTGFGYNLNQKGLASVTGRIGYTWGPALLYVKGGWAYQDATETLFAPVGYTGGFATTTKDNGYTVGAGLEYLFTQNWSGKIEYQYYDFGKTEITTPALSAIYGSSKNDQHTVKAGLNYRFNWGGPVVAKY